MKKLIVVLVLVFLAAVAVTVGRRTDLKTLIHGKPPTATPGPADAKTATVHFASGVTADQQILEFMQAFTESLRIHDGTSLKPRLSDRYAIEDLPEEHSPVDFFLQAMVKVKAPDEIVITAIERDGDVRVAKMEFRSTERGTKERTFKFDSNGKLLSADFFTLKRQHGG
ncbi:MAG: hypothetical protein QOH88_921 [Verrucomicrobiota bacterium]|jgi:hypothetical protein